MDDPAPAASVPLTADERQRLAASLATVSSRTLLNVLLDMDARNADGRLIVELLLERLSGDADQAPVIPR